MNCRITSIAPTCGYAVEGIENIRLLDFEDFGGFSVSDGLVTEIFRSGAYADIPAKESARYTSALQAGVYMHTIETFISDISASVVSSLHLATKRRYIVLFKAKNGVYHAFAQEAGATLSFAAQTADGVGCLVTLSAQSVYPLYQVSAAAAEGNSVMFNFVPDFEEGAYCERDYGI